LYGANAIVGWRAHAASPAARGLHLVQLALNAAWPGAFFGARQKRISLAVIFALDATVAAEAAVLVREDSVATALLTPYLGWCGFATAVNAAVSNPDDGAP
jgi:tryptophan-rich sensory protein